MDPALPAGAELRGEPVARQCVDNAGRGTAGHIRLEGVTALTHDSPGDGA